jgi:hypothetical protein
VPLAELVADALTGPEGVDEPLDESDDTGVSLRVAVLDASDSGRRGLSSRRAGLWTKRTPSRKTTVMHCPWASHYDADEGLTELDAEAVPDEDVVGEALSVLVSVLDGVSVGAVEPELEAEADVDWPLVTEIDAEALSLPVPLGVSAADSVLLGLAVTVPVAVSKLEPLPEAVCE